MDPDPPRWAPEGQGGAVFFTVNRRIAMLPGPDETDRPCLAGTESGSER